MVDLNLLEQLVAISEVGTISAASERLHLTQSALSRSMRKLEKMLGLSLFDRTKNSMQLNETGLRAVLYARHLIEEERMMVEHLQVFDRSRRAIAFGASSPSPLALVTPLLEKWYPDKSVSLMMEGDERILIKRLLDDELSLIVVCTPTKDENLICVPLFSEQLCVAVRPGHPLDDRETLHPEEIDGTAILTFATVGIWRHVLDGVLANSKKLYQADFETIRELATMTELPMFATSMNAGDPDWQDAFRIIPIENPEARLMHYCIAKKGRVDAFLKHLKRARLDLRSARLGSEALFARIG